MAHESPSVIVLAGPNGSGKSTLAPFLLPSALGITEFVNADVIARGLSGFSPEVAALEAGAIMLRRLKTLAEHRVNFAFETTLASRSLAPWPARLRGEGYEFNLAFLWLPDPDLAVQRVAHRVRSGGPSAAFGRNQRGRSRRRRRARKGMRQGRPERRGRQEGNAKSEMKNAKRASPPDRLPGALALDILHCAFCIQTLRVFLAALALLAALA